MLAVPELPILSMVVDDPRDEEDEALLLVADDSFREKSTGSKIQKIGNFVFFSKTCKQKSPPMFLSIFEI